MNVPELLLQVKILYLLGHTVYKKINDYEMLFRNG